MRYTAKDIVYPLDVIKGVVALDKLKETPVVTYAEDAPIPERELDALRRAEDALLERANMFVIDFDANRKQFIVRRQLGREEEMWAVDFVIPLRKKQPSSQCR